MCNKFSLQRPLPWGKVITPSIKRWTIGPLLLASWLSNSPVLAQFFEPGVSSPEPTIEEIIAQFGTAPVIVQLDTNLPTALDFPSTATSLEQKAAQAGFLQNAFLRSLEISSVMELTNHDNSVKKFQFIAAVAMTVDQLLLENIENNPLVTKVVLDRLASPTLFESIPLIGADKAWQQGDAGSGQAVVIIDTGVDKNNPALVGKVIAEACFSSNNPDYNTTSLCPNGSEEQIGPGSAAPPCDSLGLGKCYHGTHVAGIAAANGEVTGVAKDANLIAIQGFSRFDNDAICGTGNSPCVLSFNSDAIRALEHVLSLYNDGTTIAAVNLSIGGGHYTAPCDENNPVLTEAINNLREVGIASVIASGNNGYKDAMSSPACISNVISVGATCNNIKYDETNPQYNITYDNVCPGGADTVALFSNSTNFLDLLAPGMWITSTIPIGTIFGSINFAGGTSQAAPHVAGAWAVLKSIKPDLTVDQALTILKRTGVSIVDNQNNITTPRIQLDKAAQAVKALSVTLPDLSVVPEAEGFQFMWKQAAELESGGGMNLLCAQMDKDSRTFNHPVKLNSKLKAAMDQVFYPLAGVSGVQYCTLMEINAAGKCTLHCDATVVISEPSLLAVGDIETAKTVCHEYANHIAQVGVCPDF